MKASNFEKTCNNNKKQQEYKEYNLETVKENYFTAMPDKRTPNEDDVDAAALAVCDCRFAKEEVSPYCRVPILISKMQGISYLAALFSSNIYSI